MNFKVSALPLAADDVRIVAGYLQCEIAALRAVIAVEAAGKGFGPDGRPLILFEPHVFWRETKGSVRTAAARAGLAYAKWGAKPYPKTQAARYAQLEQAMKIDEAAALKSTSWGLGQLMGFNHKVCGFETVQQMVEAMTIGEGAQLMAMAKFIDGNKLTVALRSRNWAAFAKGYNGLGYKANRYDVKLADAYTKRPKSERIVPSMPSQDEFGRLSGRKLPVVSKPVVTVEPPAPVTKPSTGPEADLPLPKPATQQPAKAGPIALIIAAMVGFGAAINTYWCDYIGLFCN